MSTTTTPTAVPAGLPAGTLERILDEGYGPAAWYGSNLRAAVADVTPAAAFTRPADARHNIAEVALHHAYWAGQIAGKLTGAPAAAFPLDGEDWFDLSDGSRLSWEAITATLAASHERLSQAVSEIASGARTSPLGAAERFDLVLGISGHAAYHAGQVQLIKKLIGAA
jgi:DinB superfamily